MTGQHRRGGGCLGLLLTLALLAGTVYAFLTTGPGTP